MGCRRWPCRRFRWASNLAFPGINGIERPLSRAIVPKTKSLCVSATTFPTVCICTSRRDTYQGISAVQAVLKGRTVAKWKGFLKKKTSTWSVILARTCQRNAAGRSTAGWPANAKLPFPRRHSSITRPCCSSAKLLTLSLHALEHSTASERADALGLRAAEVIICMITCDFSVILIDVTSVSLSLSIHLSPSTTHKSHSRAIYQALPRQV